MVDFKLTETQGHIIDTARDFGREVLRPAEVELDRLANPDDVFKSETFWKAMAGAYELGFPKMAIPERFGGLGLDPQTTGMVWEELAYWGVGFASSLITASIVPQLVVFLAPEEKELVDKYVTPFCEDDKAEMVTAWCSSEPEVGSDGKNYFDPNVRHHTKAVKKRDRYILNGTKSDFVSNGGIASVYIVFACVDSSMGLRGSGTFVVPADSPGLSLGRNLDKTGLRLLNQASVCLEDVEVPENYMIFPPGEMYPMLHNAIITVGNLGVGYLAVGLMRAAFDDALAHAKQRVQWGKPIYEHQMVGRKLFEAQRAVESAQALLWKGSWFSAQNFPGDLKTSLTAKVYATEEAVRHTAEMVQIFAGYGISKEYPVEKYARDAHLLRIMDGTNETLIKKVTELL